MRIILVVAIAFLGCASLQLGSTDSLGTKTYKVAARVPMAIVTFGISEIAIRQNAQDLAWQRRATRFEELNAELDRYRRMAEEATTDADRARAIQLHDATLNEIRTLFPPPAAGGSGSNCVSTLIGRTVVTNCR